MSWIDNCGGKSLIRFMNCQSTADNQTGGRIPRLHSSRLLLLTHNYDEYHTTIARDICLAVLRDIKSTGILRTKRKRQSPAFVDEIRRRLFILHEYLSKTTEVKDKLPYTELTLLLVQYVQVEYNTLYSQDRDYISKNEKEVERRVWYHLHMVLLDVNKTIGQKLSPDASFKCALQLLNKVDPVCLTEGKFVDNLRIKLVKKLGLLDVVTQIKEGSASIENLWNNPAIQSLSDDPFEAEDFFDSDDSQEAPISDSYSSCADHPSDFGLTRSFKSEYQSFKYEGEKEVNKLSKTLTIDLSVECFDWDGEYLEDKQVKKKLSSRCSKAFDDDDMSKYEDESKPDLNTDFEYLSVQTDSKSLVGNKTNESTNFNQASTSNSLILNVCNNSCNSEKSRPGDSSCLKVNLHLNASTEGSCYSEVIVIPDDDGIVEVIKESTVSDLSSENCKNDSVSTVECKPFKSVDVIDVTSDEEDALLQPDADGDCISISGDEDVILNRLSDYHLDNTEQSSAAADNQVNEISSSEIFDTENDESCGHVFEGSSHEENSECNVQNSYNRINTNLYSRRDTFSKDVPCSNVEISSTTGRLYEKCGVLLDEEPAECSNSNNLLSTVINSSLHDVRPHQENTQNPTLVENVNAEADSNTTKSKLDISTQVIQNSIAVSSNIGSSNQNKRANEPAKKVSKHLIANCLLSEESVTTPSEDSLQRNCSQLNISEICEGKVKNSYKTVLGNVSEKHAEETEKNVLVGISPEKTITKEFLSNTTQNACQNIHSCEEININISETATVNFRVLGIHAHDNPSQTQTENLNAEADKSTTKSKPDIIAHISENSIVVSSNVSSDQNTKANEETKKILNDNTGNTVLSEQSVTTLDEGSSQTICPQINISENFKDKAKLSTENVLHNLSNEALKHVKGVEEVINIEVLSGITQNGCPKINSLELNKNNSETAAVNFNVLESSSKAHDSPSPKQVETINSESDTNTTISEQDVSTQVSQNSRVISLNTKSSSQHPRSNVQIHKVSKHATGNSFLSDQSVTIINEDYSQKNCPQLNILEIYEDEVKLSNKNTLHNVAKQTLKPVEEAVKYTSFDTNEEDNMIKDVLSNTTQNARQKINSLEELNKNNGKTGVPNIRVLGSSLEALDSLNPTQIEELNKNNGETGVPNIRVLGSSLEALDSLNPTQIEELNKNNGETGVPNFSILGSSLEALDSPNPTQIEEQNKNNGKTGVPNFSVFGSSLEALDSPNPTQIDNVNEEADINAAESEQDNSPQMSQNSLVVFSNISSNQNTRTNKQKQEVLKRVTANSLLREQPVAIPPEDSLQTCPQRNILDICKVKLHSKNVSKEGLKHVEAAVKNISVDVNDEETINKEVLSNTICKANQEIHSFEEIYKDNGKTAAVDFNVMQTNSKAHNSVSTSQIENINAGADTRSQQDITSEISRDLVVVSSNTKSSGQNPRTNEQIKNISKDLIANSLLSEQSVASPEYSSQKNHPQINISEVCEDKVKLSCQNVLDNVSKEALILMEGAVEKISVGINDEDTIQEEVLSNMTQRIDSFEEINKNKVETAAADFCVLETISKAHEQGIIKQKGCKNIFEMMSTSLVSSSEFDKNFHKENCNSPSGFIVATAMSSTKPAQISTKVVDPNTLKSLSEKADLSVETCSAVFQFAPNEENCDTSPVHSEEISLPTEKLADVKTNIAESIQYVGDVTVRNHVIEGVYHSEKLKIKDIVRELDSTEICDMSPVHSDEISLPAEKLADVKENIAESIQYVGDATERNHEIEDVNHSEKLKIKDVVKELNSSENCDMSAVHSDEMSLPTEKVADVKTNIAGSIQYVRDVTERNHVIEDINHSEKLKIKDIVKELDEENVWSIDNICSTEILNNEIEVETRLLVEESNCNSKNRVIENKERCCTEDSIGNSICQYLVICDSEVKTVASGVSDKQLKILKYCGNKEEVQNIQIVTSKDPETFATSAYENDESFSNIGANVEVESDEVVTAVAEEFDVTSALSHGQDLHSNSEGENICSEITSVGPKGCARTASKCLAEPAKNLILIKKEVTAIDANLEENLDRTGSVISEKSVGHSDNAEDSKVQGEICLENIFICKGRHENDLENKNTRQQEASVIVNNVNVNTLSYSKHYRDVIRNKNTESKEPEIIKDVVEVFKIKFQEECKARKEITTCQNFENLDIFHSDICMVSGEESLKNQHVNHDSIGTLIIRSHENVTEEDKCSKEVISDENIEDQFEVQKEINKKDIAELNDERENKFSSECAHNEIRTTRGDENASTPVTKIYAEGSRATNVSAYHSSFEDKLENDGTENEHFDIVTINDEAVRRDHLDKINCNEEVELKDNEKAEVISEKLQEVIEAFSVHRHLEEENHNEGLGNKEIFENKLSDIENSETNVSYKGRDETYSDTMCVENNDQDDVTFNDKSETSSSEFCKHNEMDVLNNTHESSEIIIKNKELLQVSSGGKYKTACSGKSEEESNVNALGYQKYCDGVITDENSEYPNPDVIQADEEIFNAEKITEKHDNGEEITVRQNIEIDCLSQNENSENNTPTHEDISLSCESHRKWTTVCREAEKKHTDSEEITVCQNIESVVQNANDVAGYEEGIRGISVCHKSSREFADHIQVISPIDICKENEAGEVISSTAEEVSNVLLDSSKCTKKKTDDNDEDKQEFDNEILVLRNSNKIISVCAELINDSEKMSSNNVGTKGNLFEDSEKDQNVANDKIESECIKSLSTDEPINSSNVDIEETFGNKRIDSEQTKVIINSDVSNNDTIESDKNTFATDVISRNVNIILSRTSNRCSKESDNSQVLYEDSAILKSDVEKSNRNNLKSKNISVVETRASSVVKSEEHKSNARACTKNTVTKQKMLKSGITNEKHGSEQKPKLTDSILMCYETNVDSSSTMFSKEIMSKKRAEVYIRLLKADSINVKPEKVRSQALESVGHSDPNALVYNICEDNFITKKIESVSNETLEIGVVTAETCANETEFTSNGYPENDPTKNTSAHDGAYLHFNKDKNVDELNMDAHTDKSDANTLFSNSRNIDHEIAQINQNEVFGSDEIYPRKIEYRLDETKSESNTETSLNMEDIKPEMNTDNRTTNSQKNKNEQIQDSTNGTVLIFSSRTRHDVKAKPVDFEKHSNRDYKLEDDDKILLKDCNCYSDSEVLSDINDLKDKLATCTSKHTHEMAKSIETEELSHGTEIRDIFNKCDEPPQLETCTNDVTCDKNTNEMLLDTSDESRSTKSILNVCDNNMIMPCEENKTKTYSDCEFKEVTDIVEPVEGQCSTVSSETLNKVFCNLEDNCHGLETAVTVTVISENVDSTPLENTSSLSEYSLNQNISDIDSLTPTSSEPTNINFKPPKKENNSVVDHKLVQELEIESEIKKFPLKLHPESIVISVNNDVPLIKSDTHVHEIDCENKKKKMSHKSVHGPADFEIEKFPLKLSEESVAEHDLPDKKCLLKLSLESVIKEANNLNVLAEAASEQQKLEVRCPQLNITKCDDIKQNRSRVKIASKEFVGRKIKSPKAHQQVQIRKTPPRAAKTNVLIDYRNDGFRIRRNFNKSPVRGSQNTSVKTTNGNMKCKPNDFMENVCEQPPNKIYAAEHNTDFNIISEDSCDSLFGLIIAEEKPLANSNPLHESSHISMTTHTSEPNLSIFDENTQDNKLVPVDSQFINLNENNDSVFISIPECEVFDCLKLESSDGIKGQENDVSEQSKSDCSHFTKLFMFNHADRNTETVIENHNDENHLRLSNATLQDVHAEAETFEAENEDSDHDVCPDSTKKSSIKTTDHSIDTILNISQSKNSSVIEELSLGQTIVCSTTPDIDVTADHIKENVIGFSNLKGDTDTNFPDKNSETELKHMLLAEEKTNENELTIPKVQEYKSTCDSPSRNFCEDKQVEENHSLSTENDVKEVLQTNSSVALDKVKAPIKTKAEVKSYEKHEAKSRDKTEATSEDKATLEPFSKVQPVKDICVRLLRIKDMQAFKKEYESSFRKTAPDNITDHSLRSKNLECILKPVRDGVFAEVDCNRYNVHEKYQAEMTAVERKKQKLKINTFNVEINEEINNSLIKTVFIKDSKEVDKINVQESNTELIKNISEKISDKVITSVPENSLVNINEYEGQEGVNDSMQLLNNDLEKEDRSKKCNKQKKVDVESVSPIRCNSIEVCLEKVSDHEIKMQRRSTVSNLTNKRVETNLPEVVNRNGKLPETEIKPNEFRFLRSKSIPITGSIKQTSDISHSSRERKESLCADINALNYKTEQDLDIKSGVAGRKTVSWGKSVIIGSSEVNCQDSTNNYKIDGDKKESKRTIKRGKQIVADKPEREHSEAIDSKVDQLKEIDTEDKKDVAVKSQLFLETRSSNKKATKGTTPEPKIISVKMAGTKSSQVFGDYVKSSNVTLKSKKMSSRSRESNKKEVANRIVIKQRTELIDRVTAAINEEKIAKGNLKGKKGAVAPTSAPLKTMVEKSSLKKSESNDVGCERKSAVRSGFNMETIDDVKGNAKSEIASEAILNEASNSQVIEEPNSTDKTCNKNRISRNSKQLKKTLPFSQKQEEEEASKLIIRDVKIEPTLEDDVKGPKEVLTVKEEKETEAALKVEVNQDDTKINLLDIKEEEKKKIKPIVKNSKIKQIEVNKDDSKMNLLDRNKDEITFKTVLENNTKKSEIKQDNKQQVGSKIKEEKRCLNLSLKEVSVNCGKEKDEKVSETEDFKNSNTNILKTKGINEKKIYQIKSKHVEQNIELVELTENANVNKAFEKNSRVPKLSDTRKSSSEETVKSNKVNKDQSHSSKKATFTDKISSEVTTENLEVKSYHIDRIETEKLQSADIDNVELLNKNKDTKLSLKGQISCNKTTDVVNAPGKVTEIKCNNEITQREHKLPEGLEKGIISATKENLTVEHKRKFIAEDCGQAKKIKKELPVIKIEKLRQTVRTKMEKTDRQRKAQILNTSTFNDPVTKSTDNKNKRKSIDVIISGLKGKETHVESTDKFLPLSYAQSKAELFSDKEMQEINLEHNKTSCRKNDYIQVSPTNLQQLTVSKMTSELASIRSALEQNGPHHEKHNGTPAYATEAERLCSTKKMPSEMASVSLSMEQNNSHGKNDETLPSAIVAEQLSDTSSQMVVEMISLGQNNVLCEKYDDTQVSVSAIELLKTTSKMPVEVTSMNLSLEEQNVFDGKNDDIRPCVIVAEQFSKTSSKMPVEMSSLGQNNVLYEKNNDTQAFVTAMEQLKTASGMPLEVVSMDSSLEENVFDGKNDDILPCVTVAEQLSDTSSKVSVEMTNLGQNNVLYEKNDDTQVFVTAIELKTASKIPSEIISMDSSLEENVFDGKNCDILPCVTAAEQLSNTSSKVPVEITSLGQNDVREKNDDTRVSATAVEQQKTTSQLPLEVTSMDSPLEEYDVFDGKNEDVLPCETVAEQLCSTTSKVQVEMTTLARNNVLNGKDDDTQVSVTVVEQRMSEIISMDSSLEKHNVFEGNNDDKLLCVSEAERLRNATSKIPVEMTSLGQSNTLSRRNDNAQLSVSVIKQVNTVSKVSSTDSPLERNKVFDVEHDIAKVPVPIEEQSSKTDTKMSYISSSVEENNLVHGKHNSTTVSKELSSATSEKLSKMTSTKKMSESLKPENKFQEAVAVKIDICGKESVKSTYGEPYLACQLPPIKGDNMCASDASEAKEQALSSINKQIEVKYGTTKGLSSESTKILSYAAKGKHSTLEDSLRRDVADSAYVKDDLYFSLVPKDKRKNVESIKREGSEAVQAVSLLSQGASNESCKDRNLVKNLLPQDVSENDFTCDNQDLLNSFKYQNNASENEENVSTSVKGISLDFKDGENGNTVTDSVSSDKEVHPPSCVSHRQEFTIGFPSVFDSPFREQSKDNFENDANSSREAGKLISVVYLSSEEKVLKLNNTTKSCLEAVRKSEEINTSHAFSSEIGTSSSVSHIPLNDEQNCIIKMEVDNHITTASANAPTIYVSADSLTSNSESCFDAVVKCNMESEKLDKSIHDAETFNNQHVAESVMPSLSPILNQAEIDSAKDSATMQPKAILNLSEQQIVCSKSLDIIQNKNSSEDVPELGDKLTMVTMPSETCPLISNTPHDSICADSDKTMNEIPQIDLQDTTISVTKTTTPKDQTSDVETREILTPGSDICNKQLTSVNLIDHLEVNNRQQNVATNKSYDNIDVDDTPVTEKVKVLGTMQIGSGSSDHDYSVGGPLLSGKYENKNLNQSADNNTSSIKGPSDQKSREDLNTSPVDGENVFQFSEQVCIGPLIENNLSQTSGRSLNESPVGSGNDYQLSDHDSHLDFNFIESHDASQSLDEATRDNNHDTQTEIDDFIEINMKQVREDEQRNIFSLIEGLNTQGLFEYNQPALMSVEKMNKLLHSNPHADDVNVAIANLNNLLNNAQNHKSGKDEIDYLYQHDDSSGSNECTVTSDCDFAFDGLAKLRAQSNDSSLTNLNDDDISITSGTNAAYESSKYTLIASTVESNIYSSVPTISWCNITNSTKRNSQKTYEKVTVKYNVHDFASTDNIFSESDFNSVVIPKLDSTDLLPVKVTAESNLNLRSTVPSNTTANNKVAKANVAPKVKGQVISKISIANHLETIPSQSVSPKVLPLALDKGKIKDAVKHAAIASRNDSWDTSQIGIPARVKTKPRLFASKKKVLETTPPKIESENQNFQNKKTNCSDILKSNQLPLSNDDSTKSNTAKSLSDVSKFSHKESSTLNIEDVAKDKSNKFLEELPFKKSYKSRQTKEDVEIEKLTEANSEKERVEIVASEIKEHEKQIPAKQEVIVQTANVGVQKKDLPSCAEVKTNENQILKLVKETVKMGSPLLKEVDMFKDKYDEIKSRRRKPTEKLIDDLSCEKLLKVEEEAKQKVEEEAKFKSKMNDKNKCKTPSPAASKYISDLAKQEEKDKKKKRLNENKDGDFCKSKRPRTKIKLVTDYDESSLPDEMYKNRPEKRRTYAASDDNRLRRDAGTSDLELKIASKDERLNSQELDIFDQLHQEGDIRKRPQTKENEELKGNGKETPTNSNYTNSSIINRVENRNIQNVAKQDRVIFKSATPTRKPSTNSHSFTPNSNSYNKEYRDRCSRPQTNGSHSSRYPSSSSYLSEQHYRCRSRSPIAKYNSGSSRQSDNCDSRAGYGQNATSSSSSPRPGQSETLDLPRLLSHLSKIRRGNSSKGNLSSSYIENTSKYLPPPPRHISFPPTGNKEDSKRM